MTHISFSLDKFRLPICEAEDRRFQPLGGWIITDISIYKSNCLDALQIVSDLTAGHPLAEGWDSENYEVEFSSAGMKFRNVWIAFDHGEYPLDEVREVIEDYWKFLVSIPDNPDLIREYRPDLPEWQAALLLWEETWARPHPYRGTLF